MAEILLAPVEGLLVGGIGHVIGNIIKNVGEKIKDSPPLMIVTALTATIFNPQTYFIFAAVYLIIYLVRGGIKTTWSSLKEIFSKKGITLTNKIHLFFKKLYEDQKKFLWITFIATFIICFLINLLLIWVFLEALPVILFIIGFFSTTIVGEIIGIIGLPAGI